MFHVKQHSVEVRHVSRETWNGAREIVNGNESIGTYMNLLMEQNKELNLISRKMTGDELLEHITHCVLASNLNLIDSESKYIDIGTGGGLPGVPLAILYPESFFLLNDKSIKKQRALNKIIQGLHLDNCSIENTEISQFAHHQTITILSKHAFKMTKMFDKTKKISWKEIILWKGLDFQDELRDIKYRPLDILAYDLSDIGEFYEGKCILKITRQDIS